MKGELCSPTDRDFIKGGITLFRESHGTCWISVRTTLTLYRTHMVSFRALLIQSERTHMDFEGNIMMEYMLNQQFYMGSTWIERGEYTYVYIYIYVDAMHDMCRICIIYIYIYNIHIIYMCVCVWSISQTVYSIWNIWIWAMGVPEILVYP